MKKNKFIGFTNDLAFKKVFGDNPTILVAFLNSFLVDKVESVTVKNGDLSVETIKDKAVRLDILAEANDGRIFNIEMQKVHHNYYNERALYYAGRLYGKQLDKGDSYGDLKPVISISILGYSDETFPSDKAHHSYKLLDDEGRALTSHVEIHFIELSKGDVEPNQELGEWISLLNTKTEGELSMFKNVHNDNIATAAAELERLLSDPEQRELLQSREDGLRDYISDMKGERLKERMELVQNMHESGMSAEMISSVTKLSLNEVVRLLSLGKNKQ